MQQFATATNAPSASARDRWLVGGGIALVSIVAWGYLVHLHQQMPAMSMADAGAMAMPMRWTVADAWLAFAMWIVMMVAMMAGAVAPALLLFAGMNAKRSAPSRIATPMFAAGYLLAWIAFSAVATVLQWLLHEAALLTPAMATANGTLAGGVLCAAGFYQFTPWQASCLRHCRSPLAFFLTHWREGAVGALALGVRHGIYCVGCCWALMLMLFAVGVMNLVWVAVLTVLVLLQKVVPAGLMLGRMAGAAMIIGGVVLLLGWS
jgi:predicted metal-binding membrane protein